MAENNNQVEKKPAQYAANLTLAAVAGQVGCLTLVVIFAALFLGLVLDKYFHTKALFTVILMVASVPIDLALMFWVVRAATSRIKPDTKPKKYPEE